MLGVLRAKLRPNRDDKIMNNGYGMKNDSKRGRAQIYSFSIMLKTEPKRFHLISLKMSFKLDIISYFTRLSHVM